MLPYFRFHHVGVAVFDIEVTANFYIDAGYQKTETIYDPIQNVNICFLNKEGMPMIELLAPKNETSPVTKTLNKSGVTPYHFCYEVDDINRAIIDLQKLKFVLLIRPQKAYAINNKEVCFLFSKQVGLIELVEA